MDQMIAWVLVNHCVLRMREERRRRSAPSWAMRWSRASSAGREP